MAFSYGSKGFIGVVSSARQRTVNREGSRCQLSCAKSFWKTWVTKNDAEEFVFGQNGKPWEQNDVRRVFWKILKDADLRRMSLHDLRHTWVTRRLSLGHHIVEVSREAGHSSIKITVDTY